MELIPPSLLAQLKPRQKAQVKRAQEALAAIPVRVKPVTEELDLMDFIDKYLPQHIRGEKAEFHHELTTLLSAHARLAIAAPRGHAKSTLVTLAYALWCAAYGKARFLLIVSDTSAQAQDHVGNIQKELLENVQLLKDFPQLSLPDASEYRTKKVRRKASDFITTGGIRFSSKGAGGGLRGLREGNQRPDLIIVDDLENDKNVQTPRQREKLRDWFTKSLSNLFAAGEGQLVVIGTILHRESLLSWLMSDKGPAVYVKRLYKAIQDDGTPLWPAAWTLDLLKAKLLEVGSKAFATEYLNNPSADDQVLFKEQWIESNRLTRDQFKTLTLNVAINITRIIIAIDPSSSADGQRDACGIVVVAKDEQNHYYVVDDLTVNASPAKWARAALDAAFTYGATEIVYESNQGGGMVESTLKAELQASERLPRLTPVHASKGKSIRAEPVAVAYERGEVSHVGRLPELELEMSTWVPGTYSPNRLDALVWGITRLMEPGKKPRFAFA